MSLSNRPPYIFFSFSQSFFFVCFLKISLKTVYLTSGIDGKRLQKVEKSGKWWEKMQKDAKRWGKMAAVLENAVFM